MRINTQINTANESNLTGAHPPREQSPTAIEAARVLAFGFLANNNAQAIQPVQLPHEAASPASSQATISDRESSTERESSPEAHPRAQLRPAGYRGLNAPIRSNRAISPTDTPDFSRQIQRYLPKSLVIKLDLDLWDDQFATEMDAKPFESFLADTQNVTDYENDWSRPQYQERLTTTLLRMENSHSYRTAVFDMCRSLDTTCGDGRSMQLDEMEDHYLLKEAPQSKASIESIFTVGCGFYIRGFADRAADKRTNELVAQGLYSDSIETKLHFRTGLRDLYGEKDAIDLPVGTQSMSENQNVSGVFDEDIEEVYDESKKQLFNAPKLLEFFIKWPPLIRHIESKDKKIILITKQAHKDVEKEIKKTEMLLKQNKQLSSIEKEVINLELGHTTTLINQKRKKDTTTRCDTLITKYFNEHRELFGLDPQAGDKRSNPALSDNEQPLLKRIRT